MKTSNNRGFTPGYIPRPYNNKMPSIYKPSPPPSRIYNKEQPQVVQTQQTLGQSIKQGFGAYIGWGIANKIFGWNNNTNSDTNNEIPKISTSRSTSVLDKCEDYRELMNKCLKNGGDWNGNDCSKFIELLRKCEESHNAPQLTYN